MDQVAEQLVGRRAQAAQDLISFLGGEDGLSLPGESGQQVGTPLSQSDSGRAMPCVHPYLSSKDYNMEQTAGQVPACDARVERR